MRLAVTNVHFKHNKMGYTESEGLATGVSLVKVSAKLWKKSFKKSLKKLNEGRDNKSPNMKGMCIDCNQRVTLRGKGVESESCKN